MAIDTAAKRAASLSSGRLPLLPPPDGTIDVSDRGALLSIYYLVPDTSGTWPPTPWWGIADGGDFARGVVDGGDVAYGVADGADFARGEASGSDL